MTTAPSAGLATMFLEELDRRPDPDRSMVDGNRPGLEWLRQRLADAEPDLLREMTRAGVTPYTAERMN